eukprot:gene12494-15909_t
MPLSGGGGSLGFALAVAAALWIVIDKTRFGVKLRASVDNAAMAAALGA